MELGNGKLLRTGLNSLNQAVHPTHGLAWTDGRRVVLTDLQLRKGEAKFGDSQVIGKFEYVCGVSWAPLSTAHIPTLLAIQHKKHVAVWQLCPSISGSSKWLLSQTSEIRESLPILPQGCVWHPKDAILTVLTAQDASIFPNVHRDGSRVKVDINTKGRIYCACWSLDGQRLVLAIDSSLHSYMWDSSHKSLLSCSFCPVFQVNRSIRSITATVDSHVAITTELPLHKLCSLNASEAFDDPTNGNHAGVGTLPGGETPPGELNSGVTVSPSSDPLDLTHIHFNQCQAREGSLICVSKKDYLTGTGQDSSHLVLVTFKKAITMTKKVAIPGILVPDLIAFNLKAQLVAVASNTCNIILIYSVLPSSMPNIQQIQLESNERPKGICFLTDKLLLISVGKPKPTETAFLPSSESDQYSVRLVFREITLARETSGMPTESQGAYSAFNVLLNRADREKFLESLSPGWSPLSQGFLLTDDASTLSGRSRRALIQEIRSPLSPPSSASIVQETPHGPSWLQPALPTPSGTPDHTSTPEPNLLQRENSQQEKETCPLSRELDILSRHLVGIHECLLELRDFLFKEKRCSPMYPLSQDPSFVHLIYQKPPSVGPEEKRAVLLCDGKLRLSTVQQMFGLYLVEMLLASHWILLSADSQGFIPLTFTASQTVVVRDGSLSKPEVARDSVSHHPDPIPPPGVIEDLATQSVDTAGGFNIMT